MKGRVRALAAVAVMGVAASAQSAEASSPASGHLMKTQRRLSWSGGPFVLSEPNYLASGCAAGRQDPICDHFALTVHLGDGALIEVSITTPNPNPDEGIQPLDGDDYDLFVYAPTGGLIAEAANTRGNERVVFRHRSIYTGKPYEVRVNPWFVAPLSRYTGTVRAMTLGRR
jgi:hypothetical protein